MMPSTPWLMVHLKLEESQLFLEQLKAHLRHPKLVLFYTSAFLSTTSSVLFFARKQNTESETEAFDKAIETFNKDETYRFLCDLTQGVPRPYPKLGMQLLEASDRKGTDEWTMRANIAPSVASESRFSWIEEILAKEWPNASFTQPIWYLEDFPGGRKELVPACEGLLRRLQVLIESLKRQ